MTKTPLQLLLMAVIAFVGGILYSSLRDDWGPPLGPNCTGVEVQPRPIASPPAKLSPDEGATIELLNAPPARSSTSRTTPFNGRPGRLVPPGSGSGFTWYKEGHVVTNFHVVYGADAITVTLADRTDYRARVVGIDPDHDLAVLQVRAPADARFPIGIGSSYDLRGAFAGIGFAVRSTRLIASLPS